MKILVVDDHSHNRDLLAAILEDEGHSCIVAVDGQQACEVFRDESEVDMILMDVNMPKMDGISATREIKTNCAESRFIPIIFVTALDNAETTSQCLEAGGDDFIAKPINEDVLMAKINAHGRSQSLFNRVKKANESLNYHKQLMDREHAVIEHVFANGSNRIITTCDNIKHYTSPVSMFNGDIVLVGPSPSGGIYVLVGDFTGHGLASSIGSLPVTEIFYNLTAKHANVSQIATEMNSCLFSLLPPNMFCCASIAYLDHQGTQLTVWAGGMNDMLCVTEGGESLDRLSSCHMPLGILDEKEFDNHPSIYDFEQVTRIYIYTDGINEASDENGSEFGLERVERAILGAGENVVEALTDEVHQFLQGRDQQDDLSIAEIKTGPVVHRSKKTQEVVDVGADYHNAESFPWKFSMRLQGPDLRGTNIVNQIMGFVASIKGIEIHQDKIFTIVSELYSNALEHGILGLKSSLKSSADGFEEYYKLREERLKDIGNHSIDLRFAYLRGQPNKVRLELTDSGSGFDYSKSMREADENQDAHGRGLHLLKSLCSILEYSNHGCTVLAEYELCLR